LHRGDPGNSRLLRNVKGFRVELNGR